MTSVIAIPAASVNYDQQRLTVSWRRRSALWGHPQPRPPTICANGQLNPRSS